MDRPNGRHHRRNDWIGPGRLQKATARAQRIDSRAKIRQVHRPDLDIDGG